MQEKGKTAQGNNQRLTTPLQPLDSQTQTDHLAVHSIHELNSQETTRKL